MRPAFVLLGVLALAVNLRAALAAYPPLLETVRRLAELGILVAPGEFYGPAGERHVRVAVTATDERIAAALERLAS